MLFITALVIFDETQTGLGRTGEHFWGFQNYGNIVPDILTCGRPLGAGHPIGACITSSRVARRYVHIFVFFIPKRAKKNHFVFFFRLGAYFSTFGGNPVSCAIGLSVLDVIVNENLQTCVRNVGRVLQEQLIKLQASIVHLFKSISVIKEHK